MYMFSITLEMLLFNYYTTYYYFYRCPSKAQYQIIKKLHFILFAKKEKDQSISTCSIYNLLYYFFCNIWIILALCYCFVTYCID